MSAAESVVPAADPAAARPPAADPAAGRLPAAGPLPAPRPAGPQAEIVIPVRNEERALATSVRRLDAHLRDHFPFTASITIADNGSTDGTWSEALALAASLDAVRAVRLERPGRGGALREVWSRSDAAVVAYMDVDLSTDLNALLPLLAPVLSGHSDVAIGTRLARGARVIRGTRREIISRCYNVLLHAALGTRFSDAQCGFKAIRRDQARIPLPRLGGPLAYSLDTAATTYGGSSPSAGPALTAAGIGRGALAAGGFPVRGPVPGAVRPPAGVRPGGGERRGGGAGGEFPRPAGDPSGRRAAGFAGPGGAGNATVSPALARLLKAGAARYTWGAATDGADSAAAMELATGGVPVMAIGGFRGTDPAPSLAAFKKLVAGRRIHYYVAGGAGGAGTGRGFGTDPAGAGGSGATTDAAQISAWVQAHFSARTVGGLTVYTLIAPAART
jgi:Glycosyl transferase family 2